MQKITPFMWFEKNNAEEAMQFYTSIFPDSKIVTIQRYPEGIKEGPMAGFDGKVLTGVFDPPPDTLAVPWGYLLLVAVLVVGAVGAAGALTLRSLRQPPIEELRDL